MNQADQITATIKELSTRENAYCTAVKEAADADADYRLALAAEKLKGDGTVAEREARALIACETVFRRKMTTEAVEKMTKEKLIDVRAALSGRQSILSAEIKGFGLGEKYSA